MHVELAQSIILGALLLVVLAQLAYFSVRGSRSPSKTIARDVDDAAFSLALRHLDRIFKRRTHLSGHLLAVAAGEERADVYHDYVELYLSNIVDDIEALFSELTKSKCVVTIKLLVDVEDDVGPAVVTAFRDRDSQETRPNAYSDIEPFSMAKHAFISKILTESPFNNFRASDNLSKMGSDYWNPNPNWASLFNASAVHAIASPGSRDAEAVYGFLCIDNRHGGLAKDYTNPLMSIISTAIFYVMSTASMLEQKGEEL